MNSDLADNRPLTGKAAVVTGAGRGIGRSIALALARAGADLAICSRTRAELEAAREAIADLGVRCFIGVADLSDPQATESVCNEILTEFGEVHVLVNNAGAQLETSLVAESDPDRWWKTVEVNVRGPYLVTRFLLPGLADGAKIINLSSGVGLSAGNRNSSYHVAKAGLHMFTESLAGELWPRRIDVNNLIPGPVATTNFTREAPGAATPDEVLERFGGETPPNFPPSERLKHPDEIGEFALYLATRPAGGPTGQTYSLARRPL